MFDNLSHFDTSLSNPRVIDVGEWEGKKRGSSFVHNSIFTIAGLVYQKLSCTLEAGVDQLSMY